MQAAQAANPVPLAQLRVGDRATFEACRLEQDDRNALRAMGLRPDCSVRVCKQGEPCIVSVNSASCRIALSRTLAARVLVRPE